MDRRTEIPGVIHTSIGMEASIVGACMALRPDDYMVGTHRSHGHPIGKGARIDRLFAELMGKATGINQGKGGSMHLSDFSVGSLGETSIVGSGLPVATGAALGSKMKGLDRVALCFFGDGAAAEGTFHESLNLASIWTLPSSTCARTTATASPRPSRQSAPSRRYLAAGGRATACPEFWSTGKTSWRFTRPSARRWTGPAQGEDRAWSRPGPIDITLRRADRTRGRPTDLKPRSTSGEPATHPVAPAAADHRGRSDRGPARRG